MVHCISLCNLVWKQFWEQHCRKNTSGTVPLPSHSDDVPVDLPVRFNASVCVDKTARKRNIAFETILDEVYLASGSRQISVVVFVAGQHSEHTRVVL